MESDRGRSIFLETVFDRVGKVLFEAWIVAEKSILDQIHYSVKLFQVVLDRCARQNYFLLLHGKLLEASIQLSFHVFGSVTLIQD